MYVTRFVSAAALCVSAGLTAAQAESSQQAQTSIFRALGAEQPVITLGDTQSKRTPSVVTEFVPESERRTPRADPSANRSAADWSNLGGNAQRNGQSFGNGPITDTLHWANDDDFSIISWHPVIHANRVFSIRQAAFPAATAGDTLVAMDLESGAEVWRVVVPYGGDSSMEWIAHVMGASDGRVYAARSGSGRFTPIYAFDAETGSPVWVSEFETGAGPQESAVFAPNGDLIVADSLQLARIDSADGSTVWEVARSCAVSGNCGAVLSNDGIFIDQPVPNGQTISKFDLATGAFLYETDWGLMPGLTVQNAPFVSPDGTRVYLARTQNNVLNDFLFAFEDTGTALIPLWNRPIRWTTSHEHGIGSDGSIYTFLPDGSFARLDADSGDVLGTTGVLSPLDFSLSPRTAVAANGTVYVSNGWASNPVLNGRIWAFSADLSENLFTLTLNRQNAGGPSLGSNGTLVVADRTSVRAYRSPPAGCAADIDGNGELNFFDLAAYISLFNAGDPAADLAEPFGVLNFFDLAAYLDLFNAGCP